MEFPTTTILEGDCRKTLYDLPAESVHMVATSPPYWGLRNYGGDDDEIGTESLHDCLGWTNGDECGKCFVCHIVQVGRAAWHCLRKDGIFFLNLGDSFVSASSERQPLDAEHRTGQVCNASKNANPGEGRARRNEAARRGGLKPKDMAMIPARCLLALQSDGWYGRMDNIWKKDNVMPGSQTDRPTRQHEYIWMLTKSEHYYYDEIAIQEPCVNGDGSPPRGSKGVRGSVNSGLWKQDNTGFNDRYQPRQMRTKRSIWHCNTIPSREGHFAMWPPKLARTMVKCGTSAKGCCPHCGAGWKRVVEKTAGKSTSCPKEIASHEARGGHGSHTGTVGKSGGGRIDGCTQTTGWEPSCKCPHTEDELVRATVLDCFSGSGTTGRVAIEEGRSYIGCELNPDYVKMGERRIKNAQPALALD